MSFLCVDNVQKKKTLTSKSRVNIAERMRSCFLKCFKSGNKILLEHGKTKALGRSKELGIPDLLLSKQQLECTADCEKCSVVVKVLGRNSSGCNGYALVKDRTYTLGHTDRLELLLGCYEYEIAFDPPPPVEESEPQPKKMKFDFSIFNKPSKDGDDTSSKFTSEGGWEDLDGKELLVYNPENCVSQSSIAAFDIDGTIIKTKSGARFPKDPDDWVLYFNDIPQKLKKLFNENKKIVFFTNQSGVGKDSRKIKDFKRKVENIVNKIGLPIQVYIATGRSKYRKPIPGMWNVLCEHKNDGIEISIEDSFYVGDAAGRPKNWMPKKNKDHSCADRLFALNIGLKFYTPEEYFLKNSSVSFSMPEFNPKQLDQLTYPDITYNKLNVVLMVGGPGSGKSHYCKTELMSRGYVHVSRDSLGSWQKCAKLLEENLSAGKNVVIDNTNPDRESRQRFIDVARKLGADCRCFVMTTTLKHSKHNNRFRELHDKIHEPVSEIIINRYKKSFQEPELSEGYTQILNIPFLPVFSDSKLEKLYKMYLLES